MLALVPTFDGKRTVPSPEVTRIMLDLLQLLPTDKLLEVGTGSSSQTRAFAQTGAIVHSVELEPWIDTTIPIGECVYLHQGDGVDGLPQEAPFTAIVACCGLEQVPHSWLQQLAEGGRLVAPIGDSKSQRVMRLVKDKGDWADCFNPDKKKHPVVGCYTKFQMLRAKPKLGKVKYCNALG